MTLRLLAVHAHPDDESSKGSATYAHYRALGAQVLVVSCTGGEQGSILNESLEARTHAERDIAGLRVLEMARAREAMGVDHLWLGYADSGLPPEGEPVAVNGFATIPLETSAEPLVAIVRRFKPHVLVTYDENGGYPHPDHIRDHLVSMEAYHAAADPDRYPEAGEPWQVQKVYYDRIMNPARMRAMLAHLESEQPESPLVERLGEMLEWMGSRPDLATTHVNVAEHFPARDAALRARQPGAARQPLLLLAERPPGRGLADRGLPARGVLRRGPRARGRPLRRRRRRRPHRPGATHRRRRGAGVPMSAASHVADRALAWALAQPVPSPTLPASTVPEESVTPGVAGFLAIAFVAIAVVLLVVDMTRRVRRTRYRGEVRERIAAEREEAARGEAGAGGLDEPGVDDLDGPPVDLR